MKLSLVGSDDPILKQAIPVFDGDPRELRETAIAMWHAMINGVDFIEHKEIDGGMMPVKKHVRGLGLAAPQVGLNLRMFVMRVDRNDGLGFGHGRVCINPELVCRDEWQVESIEGCLSYPGKNVAVRRSPNIVGAYTTLKGKREKVDLANLPAFCFQHELDHLNGFCKVGQ